MNRKLQPDSNVLGIRIHVRHVMKRMPRFHDGTVTVDTDKNRLVEFLLAVMNHQMSDWQGFGKYLKCNHHKQRVVKCACMWTVHVQYVHVWTLTLFLLLEMVSC